MNNILPLINIINTISSPLIVQVLKTNSGKTMSACLYFNSRDFIEVITNRDEFIILESLHSTFMNLDIKIADLTDTLLEIKKYLYTVTPDDFLFLNDMLAKDINNTWFLVAQHYPIEYTDLQGNVTLFYNGQKTKWEPLKI